MTKAYSVDFDHDAELSSTKGKTSSRSRYILYKASLICRENSGAKTQEPDCIKLLEITESICGSFECLSIYKESTS